MTEPERPEPRLPEVLALGPVPTDTLVRWGAEIAAGLAAEHRAGRTHGAVRAHAVRIDRDGRARLDGPGQDATRSPTHPAPEWCPGADRSPAADVYALGAMLHAAGGAADARLTGLFARTADPDPNRRPGAAAVARRLRALDPVRRRNRRVALVGLVAALAVLGMTGVALWPHVTGRTGRTGVNAIGNPRTADPCALVDAKAMHRFGATRVYPEQGVPSGCALFVQPDEGPGALVQVSLSEPFSEDHDLTRNPGRPLGDLTVYPTATGAGVCNRTLLLPDRYRVYLYVDGGRPGSLDLCAVADAAVDTVAERLARSSLPRRAVTATANSLLPLRACDLGDPATLRSLGGVNVGISESSLGGWACEWGDDPSVADPSFVSLYIMRGPPMTASTTVIGGHTATTTANPTGCVVELAQRYYQGVYDLPRIEKLHVAVHLREADESAQCAAATKVAEAAAAKLPPPG